MGISQFVVWHPLFLDPSDGVFGRFDLAAPCGCHTLNVCLFVCLFCPTASQGRIHGGGFRAAVY